MSAIMEKIFDRAIATMPPQEALFLFVVVPFMVLVAGMLLAVRIWYSMRIRQWELSLKHTMLERGMSVEEITAVLAASSSKSPHCFPFATTPTGGSMTKNSC
jgi:hypothetical protein